MKKIFHRLAPAVAISTALALPGVASAAPEGNWVVKGTLTGVVPDKSSDGLNNISNSEIFLDEAASVGFSVTRRLDSHLGVGLYTAWPFYQEVKGNDRLGRLGLHRLADVSQLPVGAAVTYHFMPNSTWRPYVGLDVDYAHFFDENNAFNGLNVSVDDAWGMGAQAGLDLNLNDRWLLTTSARYVHMKTTARLTGMIEQNVKMTLNPWFYSLGVGYRF